MLIGVTRDKNTFRINGAFASAVPEFAAVLEDESLGNTAMAYVIYCLDSADDNVWFNLPDGIREKEIAESLKLDAAAIKNPKVKAAMAKYKKFVDSNIAYKFKAAYMNGMAKVSDYVDGKKALSDADAKEFSAVLKEMPLLLKGKEHVEKVGVADAKKGIVRGKKELTINERM